MSYQFCEKCNKKTKHKEIVKQKKSKYGSSKKEQFKAFLSGFFSGTGGHGFASMELTQVYLVCEECGFSKAEHFAEECK